MGSREGLTVAVGFEKGSSIRRCRRCAPRLRGGEAWSFAVLQCGRVSYRSYTFLRGTGHDPAKGPVFARYEPPENMSPAATHYVLYRGVKNHKAFISTLINLAIRKRIKIDAGKKKTTMLTRLSGGSADGLEDFELSTEKKLLSGEGAAIAFGGKYSSALTSAYGALKKELAAAYGAPYFRWNTGYLVFAIVMSIAAVILSVNLTLAWSGLHTLAVLALVIMALAAAYFLPAATETGQTARTEIEGFRLYLKTAEQLQLNAVKVGSDAPPPMTIERYERFLPYAVALGVEKPWTRHFEKLMPAESASYQPYWTSGRRGGTGSLSGLNSALVSAMSSGVSSSLPQSSSSSGSGGGSSGGGGGGGGGGGW
ncbi:MAG: DUF2207 domain-containing protein [Parvularculaceae bacterium]